LPAATTAEAKIEYSSCSSPKTKLKLNSQLKTLIWLGETVIFAVCSQDVGAFIVQKTIVCSVLVGALLTYRKRVQLFLWWV